MFHMKLWKTLQKKMPLTRYDNFYFQLQMVAQKLTRTGRKKEPFNRLRYSYRVSVSLQL